MSSRRTATASLMFFGICVITVLALAGNVIAQTNPPLTATPSPMPTPSSGGGIPLNKVPDGILNALDKQDVLDAISKPLLTTLLQTDQTNGLLGFINDLHLRPKIFHAQDGSPDGVFGFEYDFQKSIANRVFFENSYAPLGLSLTASAKGNVAADAKKNPDNFLESGGSIHFFQGIGGIDPTFKNPPEAAAALQKALMDHINDPDFQKEQGPTYDEFAKQMTEHFSPQLFYDFQFHGTFESDQQFIKKQWTYGGKLSLAYRDWRQQSDVGWFNVLDYPFATLRWFVEKEPFQPSGRAFPSAVIGLDLVDPSMDSDRLKVDPDTSQYPRFRFESAFKTRTIKLLNQQLYFSAAVRYFQEINPSAAIEAAKLDHSVYFVGVFDLPYHFNVSYSNGKLPLDLKNQQVYAIGWLINF